MYGPFSGGCVSSPRTVSKSMWNSRLINQAGMFLSNALSHCDSESAWSTPDRRPRLPQCRASRRCQRLVGNVRLTRVGQRSGGRSQARIVGEFRRRRRAGRPLPPLHASRSVAGSAVEAWCRSRIRRTASCCASVSSIHASHCQQSASISHSRTVIGAPQSGQAHINTSPLSQNMPVTSGGSSVSSSPASRSAASSSSETDADAAGGQARATGSCDCMSTRGSRPRAGRPLPGGRGELGGHRESGVAGVSHIEPWGGKSGRTPLSQPLL